MVPTLYNVDLHLVPAVLTSVDESKEKRRWEFRGWKHHKPITDNKAHRGHTMNAFHTDCTSLGFTVGRAKTILTDRQNKECISYRLHKFSDVMMWTIDMNEFKEEKRAESPVVVIDCPTDCDPKSKKYRRQRQHPHPRLGNPVTRQRPSSNVGPQ